MSSDKLGLIAGGGRFPVLVARAASEKGIQVVAAGFEDRVDPELEQAADELRLFPFCLVGQILDYLHSRGITQAITIGTIPPVMLQNNLPQLDDMAKLLWQKMLNRRTDSMMAAVVELMAEQGIQVLDSTTHLDSHLAPDRVMTKREPEANEWQDIQLGFNMAKAIGGFDIGQTVIVKKGTVIAVEAVEGTDRAIVRTAELTTPGSVVVKVAKPEQDLRFDVPAVGSRTIDSMLEAGAMTLALEAGKVLIEDRAEMIDKADRHGLTVLGVSDPGNLVK